jgi:hypothetical protein
MPLAPHATSMKFQACGPSASELPAWDAPKKTWFGQWVPFDTVPIHLATPPDTYPTIFATNGKFKAGAAALVGLAAGAIGGAALVGAKRLPETVPVPPVPDEPGPRKPDSTTR